MASEPPTPVSNGRDVAITKEEKMKSKAEEAGDKPAGGHHEDEEEFDPVTDAIGDFGKWQLRLTFLLSLLNFPCTWHIYAFTFQSLDSDFWCAPPSDLVPLLEKEGGISTFWRNLSHVPKKDALDEMEYDPCEIWDVDYEAILSHSPPLPIPANASVKACTSWGFNESITGRTVKGQWNLVCSRHYLNMMAEMMFLAGVAIGGLVSGLLSDRFGRKLTLMASLALQITFGIILAATPWLELYFLIRFLLGFVSVSVVFSGFVICMEIVGGKWRTISGVSYLFPVPLSYITIAGICYVVRGWQWQQLAITLPAVLLLSLWWIVPESPQWLLAMGRINEVLAILKEATDVNGRPPPLPADKFLAQAHAQSPPSAERSRDEEAPKLGFLDLFRTPNIRKNSLLLYVIWFVLYFVYYGLVLNLSNIGGNIYVNTVLSGAVELPAIAICILFLLRMGRRWPLCLSLLGSGVACLCTLTVPLGRADLEWVTITMAMAGKFSISASNAMLPVFTAELFPTVVRNLGVGSSNIPAGVALMLVPYLWGLSQMDAHLPMGTLGALGVIGGLCVLLLPETANRRMPQTIEEGEEMARSAKEKKKEAAESQRAQQPTTATIT
ncbi:organic cation transporter protein-like isoform X2 [Ischnura elegans]|nr:organic cation transporter protein-like isoform X2 [Ischnura elegans]XP_046398715.1 organic cation transporter protein-like isoform X2 [Ischnura elegans]XP_046398717.1 organic cation transporter protein-like isoform X2 [Ischnura elegans]